MSTRKIVIESCGTCPHRDHKGGFGVPAYVPVCMKAKADGRSRELPFTVVTQQEPPYRVTAMPTGVIPDWCPLEVNDG